MKNKKMQNTIFSWIFYFLIIFVFILPIIRLIIMSTTLKNGYGLDNYAALLKEQRTIAAIKNTMIIALGSTAISVFLGGIIAFITAYTNIKRKQLIQLLVLAQFFIPSYIITLAWSNSFQEKSKINIILISLGMPSINIYSMGGIIFILGICNIPLVYMITLNMLRKIPRDLEWAARVSGYSQWETLFKINLVQIMPALTGGGILAFLAAIDNFSVPAFLGISSGIPVLSTYIYEKAISFGPKSFSLAAALSVILSVIAIVGTILQGKIIKRSSHMESIKEDKTIRIFLKPGLRRITEWSLLGFFIIINLIPLISMVCSSFQKFYGMEFSFSNFTFKNYIFVFTNKGVIQAVENSLLLAFITCIICIIAGTAISYMKVRKNSKAAKIAESSISLTYAMPGIVLALAMIFHWSKIPDVYGTIKILIIAYVTRYLILQIKGSTTALLSVEPSLEESASVCGSTKKRTWFFIITPLITKQVLSSSFFIFISSMTELTLSSMLAAAGTKTIGLTIFNLQQSGDYNLSTAMSTVIVGLILSGYIISVIMKRVMSLKSDKKYKKNILGLTQQKKAKVLWRKKNELTNI